MNLKKEFLKYLCNICINVKIIYDKKNDSTIFIKQYLQRSMLAIIFFFSYRNIIKLE